MKTRRLWFVFLCAVGTLGLYYWIWSYRVHAELRGYDRTEEGVDAAELCGIDPARSTLAVSIGSLLIVPPFVSQWRFYKRIRLAQELAGVKEHERINHALGFALFLLAYFLLPFGSPMPSATSTGSGAAFRSRRRKPLSGCAAWPRPRSGAGRSAGSGKKGRGTGADGSCGVSSC